jgi:hypothetical protein
MEITERVAYLRGLCEGMKFDTESNEGKLISVIIDILEDVALEIADIKENELNIGDELDALSDDLAEVEDYLMDDDDDECCCDDDDDDCCCGCCDDDEDAQFYEVKCPSCGDEITIDEDVLDLGEIDCPNCGAKLEFDIDEDDEDDED